MGRAKIPKAPSPGEAALERDLKARGIPFEREYRFHPERKWRFDFRIIDPLFDKDGKPLQGFSGQYVCDPAFRLAVEIEGGTFAKKGNHRGITNFLSDMEKYNAAVMLGWSVLRFTTEQVKDGTAINYIERMLAA